MRVSRSSKIFVFLILFPFSGSGSTSAQRYWSGLTGILILVKLFIFRGVFFHFACPNFLTFFSSDPHLNTKLVFFMVKQDFTAKELLKVFFVADFFFNLILVLILALPFFSRDVILKESWCPNLEWALEDAFEEKTQEGSSFLFQGSSSESGFRDRGCGGGGFGAQNRLSPSKDTHFPKKKKTVLDTNDFP